MSNAAKKANDELKSGRLTWLLKAVGDLGWTDSVEWWARNQAAGGDEALSWSWSSQNSNFK